MNGNLHPPPTPAPSRQGGHVAARLLGPDRVSIPKPTGHPPQRPHSHGTWRGKLAGQGAWQVPPYLPGHHAALSDVRVMTALGTGGKS